MSSPSILQSTHLPSIAHMLYPCPLCLVVWSFLSLSNLCNLYQDNHCFADTSQKTTPLNSTEKPQISLNQLLAYLCLYLHSRLTGGKQSDQQFCLSIYSGHKAGTIFDSSLPLSPLRKSCILCLHTLLAKYHHPLIYPSLRDRYNFTIACFLVPLSLPLSPPIFYPANSHPFRMIILYMELAIHSLSTLLRENSHLKFLWRQRFAGLSGSLFYTQYYFLPFSLPSVIQPH